MSDENYSDNEEQSKFDKLAAADKANRFGDDWEESESELPPVFSSWNKMYAFVIANMLFMIVFLFLISKYYE